MARSRWVKVSTDRLKGPHEGDELPLMLADAKPAALVYRTVYHEDFARFVKAGVFDAEPIDRGDFFVIVHAGDTWRLKRLVKEFSGEGRHHARIGILLGYSKEAIRWFYNRIEGTRGNRIHSKG